MKSPLLLLSVLLVAIMAFLFSKGLQGDQAHFSNDGPLGAQKSEVYKLPSSYFGIWNDQYWVGVLGGSYQPNFTGVMLWLLGPVGFNKFAVPLSMMIAGLCAFAFFRCLRFGPAVCVLGGLAAALNSNFLSNAAWGLSSRATSLAAAFLAITAVQASFGRRPILKTILAGLAIGLSVSEGGDNGALFSIFIAAYAFFVSLIQSDGSAGMRVMKGAARVALMAVFAAILAAQTLNIFAGTSLKGIAGAERAAPERRWDWATQWSLPPVETLRVVVPGLFGYRMDTPHGGNYWGGVGQEPGWEQGRNDPEWVRNHPHAFPRHSGAGEYAGVIVVIIGLWALAHSLVKAGSSYSEIDRKMIWFWAAAALVALLLSWGRHAPFYQFVYSLPYFSTIRNPMKFMHPFHMCVMILFGYGLQGMWRRYLGSALVKSPFEKNWLIGGVVLVGWVVLAFMIYSSPPALVRRIVDAGFDPAAAAKMAKFSVSEIGWSILFLLASLGVITLIFMGAIKKPAVIVGAILVIDLMRANSPWIQYYNFKEKYASNAIFEILADKPHESRVSMAMAMCVTAQDFEKMQKVYQFTQAWIAMQQVYGSEWLQHQFPFYNIQSIDQPQDPRMLEEKRSYLDALTGSMARLYELTGTRFVFGTGGNFAEALNEVFDPVKRRFKTRTRFNISQNQTGSLSAHVDDSGPFGLIEFTGALPRAKLYLEWEVLTNGPATLARLADPEFDPHNTVILSEPPYRTYPTIRSGGWVPAPTNTAPATVQIAHYSPKRIKLFTGSITPSVLLLNDKFDENWSVTVDGIPTSIIRANFLMRGVPLPAGGHSVVFKFKSKSGVFFVGLAATAAGLLLCGFLWFEDRRLMKTKV